VHDDDLVRILRSGTASMAETVRPSPPGAIRARGNQRRRRKAAGTALLVLALAGAGSGIYAGVHGGTRVLPPSHQVSPGPRRITPTGGPAPARTKHAAGHMLPAGHTGTRAGVPWPLVGAGWSLTEYSSGRPDSDGLWQQGGGQVTLWLVDPEGGRYQLYQQASTGHPWTLLAWSGDGQRALLGVIGTAPENYSSYQVITLATGAVTTFSAPADVHPSGFTRPDGTSIVAIEGAATARLQRYTLAGGLEATLASQSAGGGGATVGACGLSCAAVSSPDGTSVIWSDGGRLQLVGNGGGVIRNLPVTGAGTGASCTPVRWWDPQTALAWCVTGVTQGLWLVPASGAAPAPVSTPTTAASDFGVDTGAWQASGTVYVNQSAASTCPQAAGTPSGSSVSTVGAGGSLSAITVPGTNSATVVSTAPGRLLILGRTACPGTGALLWFSPGTGSTQFLQSAPAGQAGVVAVVPFGT
jgi:hypothetical protein